jgi:hypothetical protein
MGGDGVGVLSRHSVCAVRMSGHGRRRIFGASSVAAPCTVARSVVAWFIVGGCSVGWAMVGGGRRRHAQHRGHAEGMQRAAAEGGWQPVAHSQACIRETGHVRGLGVVFRRDGCQLCERPRAPCDLALAGDVGRPGSLSRPARGYGRWSGGALGAIGRVGACVWVWVCRCRCVSVRVCAGLLPRRPPPGLVAHRARRQQQPMQQPTLPYIWPPTVALSRAHIDSSGCTLLPAPIH